MDKKALTQKIMRTATAFAAVFGVIYAVYALCGFSPFGDMSFTYRDGDIQMLDFLRCYKRFLSGDGSMLYSLSKGLGDNMYPVFTYYLASPVNLLVFFVSYDSIPAFVNFAAAIKLASAAAAFNYYIESRYNICDNKGTIFALLLSVSYGLCSFGITAGCFLPFIEGLVFMPLFAAGVHQAVAEKRRIVLIASCALAVISSWYMGALCCLYSVVILGIELFIEKKTMKEIIRATLRYTYCMAMGLMISAAVLIPTLNALGSHGGVDVTGFGIPDLVGNPLSFLTNYKLMAISDLGSPSIFAGSFILIATVAFFAARRPLRQKIVYGIAILFTVAIFHFRPLINLYLLLHENTAFVYGYRYSYVASFLLCMIAAELILSSDTNGLRPVAAAVAGSILATLVLSSNLISGNTDITAFSVGLILLITAAATLMAAKKVRKDLRKTFAGILVVVCLLETTLNTYSVMPLYSLSNASRYQEYSEKMSSLIASLPQGEHYRVTSNTFRENNLFPYLTCCYNDPLAYGYMGLSSYSSAQSDRAGTFLDRAGYPYSASTMNIVNSSNVAVDSLLGVKYIVTDYDITGFAPADITLQDDRIVYENHYAADIAFFVPDDAANVTGSIGEQDHFEYINALWSNLTGTDAKVFVPAEIETEEGEEGISYRLDTSVKDSLYYGYLRIEDGQNVMLDVNDTYETAYSNWVAPSVFLIPENGQEQSEVRLTCDSGKVTKAVFARLDLKELERVSNLIAKERKISVMNMEDGHISLMCSPSKAKCVMVTVPYDEQWEVKVNGKKIEPELFADTFFLIPVDGGQNVITMDYTVKYLDPSLAVSIAALVIVIAMEVVLNIRQNKEKKSEQK